MPLRVYVYDSRHTLSKLLLWYFKKQELEIVAQPKEADVAFAPEFTRKLIPKEKSDQPQMGTLIFHPSLLPRHRGPDAIRWAFLFGEKYTGACWFWANDEPYGGPICELEVLAIQPDEFPNEFYERAVIPAAMKMMYFILDDLSKGIVRRRPQNHEAATIEP